MNEVKYFADVSFGKDSLAMLLRLIEDGYPLDAVRFFDTGMEFQAIYDTRDKIVSEYLSKLGIQYVEFKPKNTFLWNAAFRPVKSRKDGSVHHGYGWCGGTCRWGTTEKQRALDKHQRENNAIVYIGIAADEPIRHEREKRESIAHPLVEWGMTEKDCLEFCYERGFYWEEKEVRLYDVLDRVSCWCCRNKNMKELRAIHDNLPTYWDKLVAMESVLGQMKSKPLDEIGGGSK